MGFFRLCATISSLLQAQFVSLQCTFMAVVSHLGCDNKPGLLLILVAVSVAVFFFSFFPVSGSKVSAQGPDTEKRLMHVLCVCLEPK